MPQKGTSNQTRSAKACLYPCGPEPDLPWPFAGGGDRYAWRFEGSAKQGVKSNKYGRERRRRASGESR